MRLDPTEPYQGDDIDIEVWGHEFGYEGDDDEYFDEDWLDTGRCPRCMEIDCDGNCSGVYDGP